MIVPAEICCTIGGAAHIAIMEEYMEKSNYVVPIYWLTHGKEPRYLFRLFRHGTSPPPMDNFKYYTMREGFRR